MASIIKKKVKKYIYYYLVESARVNGKPRIVNQKYLGTAEGISKAVDTKSIGIPEAESSTVLDFGAVCALYDIAERLGIRKLIDGLSEKKKQGLSVGDYILLATINRAVSPVSKNEFFEWFDRTALHKFFPDVTDKSLSSQAFWDNMMLLDEEELSAMEDAITKAVVEKYGLSTDCLLYDNTNFSTYLDTSNPSKLKKRGNSKEKRTDLKSIGLTLMVSSENNIPLFHKTYSGNMNDAEGFMQAIEALKKRYAKFVKGNDRITLVYDKANYSDVNIEKLLDEKSCYFHVVGGLELSRCKELLGIPKEKYLPLQGEAFKGASAYRSQKEIYHYNMTAIIMFDPELIETQLKDIHINSKKCEASLQQLKSSLEAWACGQVKKGRKPTIDAVEKKISDILSDEYMKDIFNCQIIDTGAVPEISFTISEERFNSLKEKTLGKTVIYTDHTDWDTGKIVSAYRSQYHIEKCLKQMEDSKHPGFRPVYHWTDKTLRVHAFYCILALLLSNLLNMEIKKLGYTMSVQHMLDTLDDVQQVITVFSQKGKSIQRSSFSRFNGMAKEIIEKLDLLRYQI